MSELIENLYIVRYGLSGGFGGARNAEVIYAENLQDAESVAWEMMKEEYERYSGSNGLLSFTEVMEDNEITDEESDDAQAAYNEEIERWADYWVLPYSKEEEEKAKGLHYDNPFKHITDI